MTEEAIKSLGINLGAYQKVALGLTEKTAYNRYIDETKCTQTNEDEFTKQFKKEVNFFDDKAKTYTHPNVRLLSGINIDYFYSLLISDVFPILPNKCNLNMKKLIDDLETILEANKKEVQLARINRNEKYPTEFIEKVSELLCTNILTDLAIKYSTHEDVDNV